MYNSNYASPYGYSNPYGQNYGMNTQPYYNMNVQTNDLPMQGVKFVTEDEAKAFMVTPNQRVFLMDRDKSVFYIKSADSLGQSSLEAFEFKKVDKNNTEIKEPKFDIENLVKREELNNLVTVDKLGEELKVVTIDLTKKIEDLKKSINIKKYLEGEIKDV